MSTPAGVAPAAETGRVKTDDGNSIGTSTEIVSSWNESQEHFLKGISERANCMRWLHTQCNLHFESLNFYFTIPNVIISTLNGSFTMSLNALFPDPDSQKYATTIIGLVSILSAVLITMNQYVKSQQMMEAHRAAGLAYGKMHRTICNELAVRRDQRSNAMEFMKYIKAEQDRLESTSPSILPRIILKFNRQFSNLQIEKPEIAGDLDATEVNTDILKKKSTASNLRALVDRSSPIGSTMKAIKAAGNSLMGVAAGSGIYATSRKPQVQVTPEDALFPLDEDQDLGSGIVTVNIQDISGGRIDKNTLSIRKPVASLARS